MRCVRPRLHPALTCVWRDPSTIQIGVGVDDAVVLGGLSQVAVTVIKAMDGTRNLEQLADIAMTSGGSRAVAHQLVETLVTADVLVNGDQCDSDTLDPDSATAALLTRTPDAGKGTMQARRARRVDVRGAGRVGAMVARLLAAAGIGEVNVEDSAITTTADVSPGGLDAADVGKRRDRAVRDQIRGRIAAESFAAPDLVVFALDGAHPDTDDVIRTATAHMLVTVVETTGFVGPLVVPGESPCLRCVDLHRTDRDPGWPLVVDQYSHRPPPSPACDIALATTVAGLAASQIVAHLDGFPVTTVGGTIEISLPAGLPRRRTWHPHPACGCTWARMLETAQ